MPNTARKQHSRHKTSTLASEAFPTEGKEGTYTRYEAREKNTLVTVSGEKGLNALNQIKVSVQRANTENLTMVSLAEPERQTVAYAPVVSAPSGQRTTTPLGTQAADREDHGRAMNDSAIDWD